MIKPRKPPAVHPGEILQELLEQHKLSQSELARHLRTSPAYINDVCRGRRNITVELAVKLGKAFRQNPEFWINMQTSWDLQHAGEFDIKPLKLSA